MAIEIEFKTTIAFDDDTSLEEFVAFDQKLLRFARLGSGKKRPRRLVF